MLSYFRSWMSAWVESAYGTQGYWQTAQPQEHFRTASTSTPQLAELVVALLRAHPRIEAVVEVGAGDGWLLADLAAARPELALSAIEIRDRPARYPPQVRWVRDTWDVGTGRWRSDRAPALLARLDRPTLIVCVEWLDDLPCQIGARDGIDWRVLEVDPDGNERFGALLDRDDQAWAQRWWPTGQRVEIGRSRDHAWAAAIAPLRRHGGLGLLIDYGHSGEARPVNGSLTGYRAGRQVDPLPSPELNLTAHVAVDSVAAAGERVGGDTLMFSRLGRVARDLLPDSSLADPLGDLVRRSQRAALEDPQVWGNHWWVVQQVLVAE
jgi:SAM-dependent MidA family methyltransferase